MSSVFGTNNRTKSSKKFEIRLDSPFVVFHGEPYESDPVELTGSLILNNADSINARSIKIKLEGKWKVQWMVEPSASTMVIRDKGTILSEERVLYPTDSQSNASHKIAPGSHEWRFSFQMGSHLPESVEGLSGNYIVYDLTAEIDRGYMSKNLVATKHLRVVRTFGRDLTDTVPMPYSNEDTWRDKVWYNIYLPTRYYIFGTSVTAEFTLCPLNKGVTIGKIKMEILERVTLSTESSRFKTRQSDQVVAVHEQDMPENSLRPLTEEQTGIADESYHFKITLPLERSLVKARQSLDTEHIKIWHNLKIYVNLHNPDGHISQLVVRNLLHIFISPNLPVGDDQCVVASSEHLTDASAIFDGASDAPPTYGLHQLDQLYDEIDTGAFVSGVTTPCDLNALSRSGSMENVRSVTDTPRSNSNSSNESSPNFSQLQSRLAALQERPDGIDNDFAPSDSASALASALPRNESNGSFIHSAFTRGSATSALRQLVYSHSRHHSRQSSNRRSPSHSPPSSHPSPAIAPRSMPASNSPGTIAATPPAIEYDMAALARIPSYNTAVRTPLSQTPPSLHGLLPPTYADATSAPASPSLRGQSAAAAAAAAVVAAAAAAAAVRVPPRAHTFGGRAGDAGDAASLSPVRAVAAEAGV